MTKTPRRYKVTFYREWMLMDGTNPDNQHTHTAVPAGEYTVVEITNPYGHAADWLVLEDKLKEGNKVGMAKGCWFDWPSNGEDPLWVIDIVEIKN